MYVCRERERERLCYQILHKCLPGPAQLLPAQGPPHRERQGRRAALPNSNDNINSNSNDIIVMITLIVIVMI